MPTPAKVVQGIPIGSVCIPFGFKLEDTTGSTIRDKVEAAMTDFLLNHPKGATLLVHSTNRPYILAIFKERFEVEISIKRVKLNEIYLVPIEDKQEEESTEET